MDENMMPRASPHQPEETSNDWYQYQDGLAWGHDGSIAGYTGNQYLLDETSMDLSSTDMYHVQSAAQPPPHYGAHQHPIATNEDCLDGTELASTSRDGWQDQRQMSAAHGLHSFALQIPQFSFDHTMDNTLGHVPSPISDADIDLQTLDRSPVSPSNSLPFPTQPANHRPWSPLHMIHGTVPYHPVADCTSSVSSGGRRSSRAGLSSASITRATRTSETSENHEYAWLADSNLTERPLILSPGLSPGVGSSAWPMMAQPGGPHIVRGDLPRAPNMQHFVGGVVNSSVPSQHQTETDMGDGRPDSSSIECEHPGCFQKFKGTHRRGTMHRHMRLKHGGPVAGEKSFPCEVAACTKTFKRQDARLKHYRSRHPELRIAAATRRKERPSM